MKVIEMKEEKMRIELPNGAEVAINGNKEKMHVTVYHHDTSMAHDVKLSEFTDFKRVSDKVTLSSCETIFETEKNVTFVKD